MKRAADVDPNLNSGSGSTKGPTKERTTVPLLMPTLLDEKNMSLGCSHLQSLCR